MLSIVGPIILHGPHHSAQKSTSTGLSDFITFSSKFCEVNSSVDTVNPIIDALASNYNIYRNQGRQATGSITVTVNAAKTYYLPTGLSFIQPNTNFIYTTITKYVISATSSPIRLVANGGLYSFTIPVQATEIGAGQQVSVGTAFDLQSFGGSGSSSLPEFVSATAASGFIQGQDQETDKELITRFRLGLSTANLISANSIESILQSQYPTFESVSLVSTGDPEQIRGTDNPFGIVLPGMVDVYIRMCFAIPTVTTTLQGTYDSGSALWTINVPAETVPGFYTVTSVTPYGTDTTGSLVIENIAYGYESALYATKNIVTSTEQARFSKYQTAVITFPYVSDATTANFNVTFLAQPNIAEIQSLFLDPATRIPCADYLVKSVVPCNVSIDINLIKKSPLDNIDADVQNMTIDIFNYINGLEIGKSVNASQIIDICHNYNILRVDLPIIMKGSIFSPYSTTDQIIYISDSDVLAIPYLPELGVTPNNSAFFINYTNTVGNSTINITY